eukprot:1156872-Pelagomonas_calceolata.AAC.1
MKLKMRLMPFWCAETALDTNVCALRRKYAYLFNCFPGVFSMEQPFSQQASVQDDQSQADQLNSLAEGPPMHLLLQLSCPCRQAQLCNPILSYPIENKKILVTARLWSRLLPVTLQIPIIIFISYLCGGGDSRLF